MRFITKRRFGFLIFSFLINAFCITGVGLLRAEPIPENSSKAPSQPSWAEQRDEKLAEVKKQREASKNMRQTRRYFNRTSQDRSGVARKLTKKTNWLSKISSDIALFYAPEDKEKVESESESIDKAYKKILSSLGKLKLNWESPIEIFFVRDKDFFTDSARLDLIHPNSFSIPWEGEIFIDLNEESDAEDAVAHHLAHVVLRQYLDTEIRSGAFLPLWIDEGFSVYQSASENYETLKQVMNEEGSPKLAQTLSQNSVPESKELAQAFQVQWALITKFILERYGASVFRSVIDVLLSSGALFAYREGYNPSLDQARQSFEFLMKNTVLEKDFASLEMFEKAWQEFINKTLRE